MFFTIQQSAKNREQLFKVKYSNCKTTGLKCTGFKKDWTKISTITTTTQFPVDPGTVVEVELTCKYADAVRVGSTQMTCLSFADYTYEKQPRCELPGLIEFQILEQSLFSCNMRLNHTIHITKLNPLYRQLNTTTKNYLNH